MAGPAATATVTLGPGEGLDLLLEWGGRPIGYDLWEALRRQLDWLEKHWQLPDDGIWESGRRRRRSTYSAVMTWVAFERAIRIGRQRGLPAPSPTGGT